MKQAERRGLVLAFGVFGVFWGAWAASLPAVRLQADVSDGRLGLALAAIAVAATPSMLVTGRLVDRFGPRRALPASLVAFGVVLWLPALAHSLPALVGALVLLGLVTGGLDIVVNAATAGWERIEADHLMSVGHGAFSAGVLVGSVAAGLAREAGAGPLPIMLAVSALSVLVGLTQPAYRTATGGDEAVRGGRRLPWLLVGMGLLVAGSFLCEDALLSWSALHLERDLSATPAVSGLGPGLFAGTMAAGRLMGTALSRRFPEDRLVGGAATLLAVGALVVATTSSTGVALAGLVLAGAGTSVLAPVLYSAVGARAAAGKQGADLATVSALGYAGFVAGPPVVGALSAATSLPVALGCLSAVAAAIAVGGLLLLRSGRMAT